ncbi:Ribosomal protein S18 acetylase RimI [Micromonospora inyonensis]|uniref:Ribosomal protein S18 acetylase RimI n=2 Tax=Micromonospora inyonensis TaxID=47866 RepID=A0A1C6RNH4_9ACTN|nr:Ribosomal protein S18 acetylase RimI [Micromonospora inyonensis]
MPSMPTARVIRPYRPDDWTAIARIHDAARLDELRPTVGVAAFLSLADTAEGEGLFDGDVWVAEQSGEVVGFVAFADDEVTWLYVDPARYRQGHGRALLRHALAAAGERPVETTVLVGNDGALALYLAEGFRIEATKTGRLAGNEAFAATGHIMVRPGPA